MGRDTGRSRSRSGGRLNLTATLFCTNCGAACRSEAICDDCGLDPFVLETTLKAHLARLDANRPTQESSLDLEFPGERTSLLLSISLLVAVGLILGALTLGLILLAALVALLHLRATESRARRQLSRVNPKTDPVLWNLVQTAAFRLDVKQPPVFVIDRPTMNAYTAGFWGEHYVVLHSRVLELCGPRELLFLLGHEFGHAKLEHVTWLTLANGRRSIAIPIVGSVIGLFFNSWSNRAEKSADRAGLMASRDLDAAERTLVKLAYGPRPFEVDDFMREAEQEGNPFSTALSEILSTHPQIPTRIKELRRFAKTCTRKGQL